ncbi:MAG: hypothetical protein ACI8ZM_003714 [Crocinitomix sp.]|jgi:hypothetical protein
MKMVPSNVLILILVSLVITACNPGNLTHERYIQNNTSEDTIIVINPDFDDAKDTILPGDIALIYSFEILDTKQEFEPCAWIGDTLIVKTTQNEHLTRSVKAEDFWTYTIQGESERIQRCTFVVITADFE